MSSNASTPVLPAPAPVHELNATFGVLLIGFIFAVTLYGLTFFRTSLRAGYCVPFSLGLLQRRISIIRGSRLTRRCPNGR